MSGQHTPGPWVERAHWSGTKICDAAGYELALVYDAPDFPSQLNAKPMLGAPELLAALQQLLADAESGPRSGQTEAQAVAAYWPKRVAGIRAAIAKATGDAT